jgi:signal transduction histidine kinase
MKTQVKIALILIVTNLAIVASFGAGIYLLVQKYSFEDFYKRLKTRATIAAQYTFESDSIDTESFDLIRKQHLERLDGEKEYYYLLDGDGDFAKVTVESGLPENFFKGVMEDGVGFMNMDDTFYAGIRYIALEKTYVVVVSARNQYAVNHLKHTRNVILTSFFVFVAITTYLSFYLSRRLFDPIRNLADKVRNIGSENIHLRIEDSGNDREVGQLISTFNDLLNRLETSFAIQNNFISNASHEFSTPLTAIMGEAEVMLMKERGVDEYKQSLRSILVQGERLNEITKTLLYLAETGYSNKIIETEIVRTDELLWEAKEIINRLNPGNQIQVDMSLLPENPLKLKIRGNKSLLIIAITNILSNACKYSNNRNVAISIASADDCVYIVVKDHGIGIPESEIPFIYDPFFRASNTHKFEGYGIGLPLTRNIIRIHKGRLDVISRIDHGTTVEIRLPQAVLS